MQVNWIKHHSGWYRLDELDLNSSHLNHMIGVYVICYGGNNPRTVRVGQGFIGDRLQAHRNDFQVQAYDHLGLYVTWASIPANSLNGVEAFLAQHLRPLVGQNFPNALPVQVNLPW